MPYKIKKQKCTQSDDDKGTYTLSYTDKKGKKRKNCHTSLKNAQGQIAAIEGQWEGNTGASLRSLIREILNENQSRLDSSKLLGYMAEWATWQALTGKPGFELGVTNDTRVKPVYDASDESAQQEFEEMYNKMLAPAITAASKIRQETGLKLGNAKRPDIGTATEQIDVVTSDADIHVKFNDAARLAGFQRAKKGVESSATSKVYDKVMKVFGNELDIDERFIDSGGFLRRPAGVKGMSKMNPKQRTAAEELKDEFQDSRDQYRLAFTNSIKNTTTPGYREEFLALLDKAGIRQAIISDIKKQLLGEGDKAAIYFKYFTSGQNVTLDTHQYSLEGMKVAPMEKESTKFYKVTSEDGSKEYFHIEFRLDGGGHPPQLKVGPDLDKK